jgi:hypothetical protein
MHRSFHTIPIVFACVAALLAASPLGVSAATFFVRAGAVGDESGSSWVNAFSDVPASLQRGSTYYIADGEYGDVRFADPLSGTSVITLKKAIQSDHGTDTGWLAQYGDGQTVFDTMTFDSGYYHIDGQTGGGPTSWTSGHGIKIHGLFSHEKLILLEENADFVTVEHLELEHRGLYTGTADDGVYSLSAGHNFTMRDCYLHNFGRAPILTRYENNWLIERNYIALNSSSAEQHSEAWSDIGSTTMTVRNNMFIDIEGTAFIAFLGTVDDVVENWSIHGNVFCLTPSPPVSRAGFGDGVIAVTKGIGNNMKVYNNAFVNIDDTWFGRVFFNGGVNNVVYNNIWFKMGQQPDLDPIPIFCDTIRSHNGFLQLNGGETTDDPGNVYGEEDPFVDWQNLDFHLKPGSALIDAGLTPDPGFQNVDQNGSVRGFDGAWDIGPIEYIPPPVWIDYGYSGEIEMGTEEEPFNTLLEGADAVPNGGLICFKPGVSAETIRIAKAMILTVHNGVVRIGTGAQSEPAAFLNPDPGDDPGAFAFPALFPSGDRNAVADWFFYY